MGLVLKIFRLLAVKVPTFTFYSFFLRINKLSNIVTKNYFCIYLDRRTCLFSCLSIFVREGFVPISIFLQQRNL